jgi:hypothetical protein
VGKIDRADAQNRSAIDLDCSALRLDEQAAAAAHSKNSAVAAVARLKNPPATAHSEKDSVAAVRSSPELAAAARLLKDSAMTARSSPMAARSKNWTTSTVSVKKLDPTTIENPTASNGNEPHDEEADPGRIGQKKSKWYTKCDVQDRRRG